MLGERPLRTGFGPLLAVWPGTTHLVSLNEAEKGGCTTAPSPGLTAYAAYISSAVILPFFFAKSVRPGTEEPRNECVGESAVATGGPPGRVSLGKAILAPRGPSTQLCTPRMQAHPDLEKSLSKAEAKM